jgi:SAM-dependent methyltransferase
MALLNRPRLRWLADIVAARHGEAADAQLAPGEPEPLPEPPAPQPITAADLVRSPPAGSVSEEALVTGLLHERLSENDRARVLERILSEPEPCEIYEGTESEQVRRFLLLAYGVWFGFPEVLEKTGLTPEQPPDEVHAMARGPLAAAGGLYEADMIAAALRSAGVDIAATRNALDFGCSSGRVLRVLHAAYPDARWRGCDPNEQAIGWAVDHLRGIDFFASEQAPPLGLEQASLDLVYAISIWSHFEPAVGLLWFEEMRRVLRPGGRLLVTTHGLSTIAHDTAAGVRAPEQSHEIAAALYRVGAWYHAEFGEEGDWGVVSPDWGTAFLSPEWMLAQLCPRWRVLYFAAGRNQGNQDVYVLERA